VGELADGAFLCLDHTGQITAAYPFSTLPTRHQVRISGNATVLAMCAIDGLGISVMTGLPVVIESADPSTGEPITVDVDGASSTWYPATAVVYAGRTRSEYAGPSASVCCGYINFFATRAAATAWAAAHQDMIRGRGGMAEHARFVIGADGRNSRVAKRVGAPAYAAQPTLSCWYFSYWSEVAWDGLEMYRRGHRMIFAHPTNDDLFAVFAGWPIAELPAVRSDIEAQMMAVVDRVPDLSQRIRSGRREERIYGAAQLPNFLRKPYGPGWALVGDAGVHKDPARALGICDALRDAELLADSLTASLSGGLAEAEAVSEYERRRNEATMGDYEANLRAARFSPPAPEILQARAAARDDPEAMAQFCLAWEGRISQRTPAAKLYEPPRADLDVEYRPAGTHARAA
jgi:hypothetical protein